MNYRKALFQKTNSLLFSVILLIGSTIISCSTKQKIVQTTANTPVVITYEKKRNRGNKLPLYTIEVLENKMVRYTGIANVAHVGERILEVQTAHYERIMSKIKEANFKNLQATYKGNKRDLPLTAITYDEHTITYQEVACPKELMELANLLEEVVEE